MFTVCVCDFSHRGVRDASRPARAGRGRDAGVSLSAPFLPVRPGPKGGHAGRRRPDAGEARRQTHPPRLPTDDHQTRQRNDRHVHLANYTQHTHTLKSTFTHTHPNISPQRINTLFVSGLSQCHPGTQRCFFVFFSPQQFITADPITRCMGDNGTLSLIFLI